MGPARAQHLSNAQGEVCDRVDLQGERRLGLFADEAADGFETLGVSSVVGGITLVPSDMPQDGYKPFDYVRLVLLLASGVETSSTRAGRLKGKTEEKKRAIVHRKRAA